MNHKKIAEIAHVSVSTVSKALAGSAEISAETADAVRKIAMEMGYFKEKSKRKRSYTKNSPALIAVIIPEVLGSYFSACINSIKQIIEEKGGQTAFYIFDYNEVKLDKIINSIILRGSADGMIIFSSPPRKNNQQYNIPMIFCDVFHSVSQFDVVSCKKSAVMNEAVRYLKSLGHTSIGFVGDPRTSGSKSGFMEAMRKHGLQFKEEFSYAPEGRYEKSGLAAAEKILDAKERPTAFAAAYDEIAIALIHTLLKNGVRVPEDISVIGVNNIVPSSYSLVPLTTVDVFGTEQYKTAVDLLFDKILNEVEVIKHIDIEPKLVVRESTAPPKHS